MWAKWKELWPKRWFKNLVYLAILSVLFFTGAGKWIHIQVIKLTMRGPNTEASATSNESVYTSGFALSDLSGQEIDFYSFKGKPVVVNFWATWCGPCQAEFGSFEDLREAAPDVHYVFISHEELPFLTSFIRNKGYDLPFYKQASREPELLKHDVIPATFILDREGHVVQQHFGAARWSDIDVVNLLKSL